MYSTAKFITKSVLIIYYIFQFQTTDLTGKVLMSWSLIGLICDCVNAPLVMQKLFETPTSLAQKNVTKDMREVVSDVTWNVCGKHS